MPSGSSSCPTAVRSISDQPPRPRAADCSRSGSTLWELSLEPGWWRTNTSSRDIRSCRDDQSDAPGCAGGKNESVCKPGLTGPYCRVRCATAWLAHVHCSALGHAKVDARTVPPCSHELAVRPALAGVRAGRLGEALLRRGHLFLRGARAAWCWGQRSVGAVGDRASRLSMLAAVPRYRRHARARGLRRSCGPLWGGFCSSR